MNETAKSGVRCPVCQHPKCPATATYRRDRRTLRIRKCAACGHKFRTAEHVDRAAITSPARKPRLTP